MCCRFAKWGFFNLTSRFLDHVPRISYSNVAFKVCEKIATEEIQKSKICWTHRFCRKKIHNFFCDTDQVTHCIPFAFPFGSFWISGPLETQFPRYMTTSGGKNWPWQKNCSILCFLPRKHALTFFDCIHEKNIEEKRLLATPISSFSFSGTRTSAYKTR